MDYWHRRNIVAQRNVSELNVREIERKLAKYYIKAQKEIIGQFITTYQKVLLSITDGRTPTAADLYKLDTYWQGQTQLRNILKELGNKEAELLSAAFIKQYSDIYQAIAIPGAEAFNTLDLTMAAQVIESIWAADGKAWSERIWDNTALLAQTLEDELIHCVISGKKTTELKNILQNRFDVSYRRADMLVRTEIAHITTTAAQKRYEDAGVSEVEVWADKDERRCEHCGSLHQKRFPINGKIPIPAHPNCRCNILPVVEI
jgi:SPP1 gp7 family putative phage head morphogenesis protein